MPEGAPPLFCLLSDKKVLSHQPPLGIYCSCPEGATTKSIDMLSRLPQRGKEKGDVAMRIAHTAPLGAGGTCYVIAPKGPFGIYCGPQRGPEGQRPLWAYIAQRGPSGEGDWLCWR